MTTTTRLRPSWCEVAAGHLADQLGQLAADYLAEAKLWHGEPGHETVARAASQLSFQAQLVRADCEESVLRTGDDWLKAARRVLPGIQTTRERRTLGTTQ